ncbi:MAG: NAD(P)H-dependent oxidoreductase subunit E [Chloroflexi bacterium]|nr:NAD(P)H-dependent oxidoreductase subunit E [Chloroflexota bacterium]
MNQLATKYKDEISRIMAKYPPEYRRSAVMPLLYLAQREMGYLTDEAMQEIAEITEMGVTEVASIVGFYTLFHDQPGGKYRMQVCTDLPCALRGADRFLEELCQNLGIQPGETTPDGLLQIEEVKCLAACHRAPMYQVQSPEGLTFYEHQTVESALEVIAGLRASEQGKGGQA